MKRIRAWAAKVAPAASAVALVLLAAGAVLAGAAGKAKEPAMPSYTIPNIVAVVTCAAALGIACKRFRRV